jgi:hypothetical protein
MQELLNAFGALRFGQWCAVVVGHDLLRDALDGARVIGGSRIGGHIHRHGGQPGSAGGQHPPLPFAYGDRRCIRATNT